MSRAIILALLLASTLPRPAGAMFLERGPEEFYYFEIVAVVELPWLIVRYWKEGQEDEAQPRRVYVIPSSSGPQKPAPCDRSINRSEQTIALFLDLVPRAFKESDRQIFWHRVLQGNWEFSYPKAVNFPQGANALYILEQSGLYCHPDDLSK